MASRHQPGTDLLTTRRVQDLLQIERTTIYRLVASGRQRVADTISQTISGDCELL
jgi:hypothetical protein